LTGVYPAVLGYLGGPYKSFIEFLLVTGVIYFTFVYLIGFEGGGGWIAAKMGRGRWFVYATAD